MSGGDSGVVVIDRVEDHQQRQPDRVGHFRFPRGVAPVLVADYLVRHMYVQGSSRRAWRVHSMFRRTRATTVDIIAAWWVRQHAVGRSTIAGSDGEVSAL